MNHSWKQIPGNSQIWTQSQPHLLLSLGHLIYKIKMTLVHPSQAVVEIKWSIRSFSRTAWFLTSPQEILKNRKDNVPTARPERVPPFSWAQQPECQGAILELCHLQPTQGALSLHQIPLMLDICTGDIQQAKPAIYQTKFSPTFRANTWKTLFMRFAFKVCLNTQSRFNAIIKCFIFIYICVCIMCVETQKNHMIKIMYYYYVWGLSGTKEKTKCII